jgi:signal transduction histidine kinase
MTFRLKVVLWFSLSLLISLVAVHLATIGVVRLLIYDELDSSLEAEVNWLDDFLLTYKGRQVPDSEICDEIQQRSRMNPRKEFISIWDAKGNSYFNTRNLEGQSLPRPDSVLQPITLKGFRGQDMRFVGKSKGGYSIAIGYSLTDTESAIRSIVISSNILLPVIVLFAFAGGLLLVGRLLRPINEVNRYLAAAASHPLTRDLPHLHVGKKDEIGELSRRVTETVGKMRTSMRWILSYSSLVPHQLRTPLAIMRSQLENAMQERATRTQCQEVIASTYDEMLKLNDTIEELLTLGKLQAGTFQLQMQKLRMRNFLEGFREEAAPLAGCKNMEFVLEEGPDILLTADMQWIRQALFNLLDNAIRHTPEGGRIVVRYAIDEAMVNLQISDTGEGIPGTDIPGLFEPFRQGENRDRTGSGAGLGLVLVKLIATAHHGSVHVASIPGKGTTFTISLPLHPETTEAAADAPVVSD